MTERSELAPELFKPVQYPNNFTEFYVDGPDCLDMLLREINKAQHYIHVQVMLFYSDKVGFRIAEALAKKAMEGVKVRVMSDSQMSYIGRVIEKYRSEGVSDFSDLKHLFLSTGVNFEASDQESYHIYNWDDKRAKLKEKGVPEEFLVMQDAIQEEVLLNLNVLDHRKLLIFDGVSAVVMSMNIGDKYLFTDLLDGQDNHGIRWHDGAMLVKGPCVSGLNKNFASKWMVRGGDVFDYQEHYRDDKIFGSDTCTIYNSFPGMKENPIRHYYLRKIRTCKGPFIIENPYINDEQFWSALAQMEEEQARKITIINPYKAPGNDYGQNTSAIKCNMWEPLQRGITFYSYCKRMSHLKIALDVAESEVFYGSYNLNHRSAMHDFELNILVESKPLADRVLKLLQNDIAESKQITDADEFYEHPLLHPSCLLLKSTEFFE